MKIQEYKNILFFFSTTTVGGAETNILKISRELTKQGISVFWCVLVDNGPLINSVDFELKGYLELGLYYKKPVSFYKKYKTFIQENKIDIVSNFGLRVEIISRLISKKIGVNKIISNIRSTDDWRRWYHVFLDKITSSSVDLWISNSNAAKEVFHKREKIPYTKIIVIYNFYDSVVNRDKETQLAFSKDNIVNIGVLANITKEKGYYDLIELSKRLISENIKHRFCYAGIDKLKGQFNTEIIKANLENYFEYFGYISDKKQFFEKIDIFLLPSYLEGMPTVVLEALSYRKPIVATDVGGTNEIIENGINGYLCKPGDIDGFLNSLNMIIQGDAKRFIDLSERTLEKFAKEKIVNLWLNIITDN